MARLIAISDTHIPRVARELPVEVLEAARGADLILHAGDLVEASVLGVLQELAPVAAVAGNMDHAEVRALLPERRVLEVEGKRIGLVHGSGPPLGIERRVLAGFGGVDAVVFGHTHSPLVEERKGVLLINPGTPNDLRFSRRLSYAVIEVSEGGLRAEIVWL